MEKLPANRPGVKPTLHALFKTNGLGYPYFDDMMETVHVQAANGKRPLKLKTRIAIFVVIAVLFSGTVFLSRALLHQRREPPAVSDDSIKKLGIEKPKKRILAPDFALENISGMRTSLKSFKGKVIFLNFWATWCVPCRQEMPTMEKLHREYRKEGLEVLAVNFRETKEEAVKFVNELGLSFTVLLDEDGKVSEEYGVWSLPLSYFINRKGEFVGKVIGYRKWDSSEGKAFFQDLLAEKP